MSSSSGCFTSAQRVIAVHRPTETMPAMRVDDGGLVDVAVLAPVRVAGDRGWLTACPVPILDGDHKAHIDLALGPLALYAADRLDCPHGR